MTRWTAFAGVAVVVLSALLILARLSQSRLPTDRTDLPYDAGEPRLPTSTLLANVALTQGTFGAFLALAAWWARVPPAALGLRPLWTPRALAVGAALGVGLWLASELAGRVVAGAGVDVDEGLRTALTPDTPAGWAVLLLAVLPAVALFEEFLFRAVLIGALAAGFGVAPWALAVGSSVAFALGHGAQGPAGVLATGVLGLALAAAFVLTGSLAVVAVAHYLVNALEFVIHEALDVGGRSRPRR